MRTCLYYWLIDPIREKFLDTSESIPVFELPIMFENRQYTFAVFVDNYGLPEYARLTIPGLDDNVLPNKLLPMIQTVKEHLAGILRITYHLDISLLPFPLWTFLDDISTYSMGVEISQITRNMSFDPQRAFELFSGSFDYREELRLFLDGQDHRIPLQYRFLSLYKILELYYRINDKWLNDELQDVIRPYENEFKDIGVTKKPLKHLYAIRDKCAHIKTRGKKETFGVTQLNHKDYSEVKQVLPILTKICASAINIRAAGSLLLPH